MIIEFSKYQGAGNDFIIIDCRKRNVKLTKKQIEFLCNRRFGVGADGLMTIYNSTMAEFEMKYYNSDGLEASMCGNGGRCIARYAFHNKIAGSQMSFLASDGLHKAIIKIDQISLSMSDVKAIQYLGDGFFLNTGSPHFVKIVKNIDEIDVGVEGLKLANDKRFAPNRTNVDFVDLKDKRIRIATYERGVENETLACGTGAVASALVLYKNHSTDTIPVIIYTKGGILSVHFTKEQESFVNIVLSGPAEFVYKGEIII